MKEPKCIVCGQRDGRTKLGALTCITHAPNAYKEVIRP